MKKIFSGVAFVLFVLALVWLFTYDSSNPNYTASSRRYNPTINNDRVVRQQPEQPRTVAATYTAPVVQEEVKPINNNNRSGRYVGAYQSKSYTRQGQTGVYKGAFDDYGQPVGYAVMEYKNGNKFIGEYRGGERSGRGYSIFKSTGKVKEREYNAGNQVKDKARKDLKFKSKSYAREGQSGTYTGPFKNNSPHGIGVYKYSNGDLYVGQYSNGARHGKGTLCKNNGSCYEQVYRNGDLASN